jgi:hypothetical protein
LDHASTERVDLFADLRDGKFLPAAEGPLRVIVPGEKRQARWVRQVRAPMIRRAEQKQAEPKYTSLMGSHRRRF